LNGPGSDANLPGASNIVDDRVTSGLAVRHHRRERAEPDNGAAERQGCSTLSTEAQLEQGIEAAQRGGVSLLAERGSAIALQDVVGE